jgi:glycosyltransferase involved in cell wall biosynthesis
MGNDRVARLRLTVQQPALPKYRVPLFAELGRRLGAAVRILHGTSKDRPPSVVPAGFEAEAVPERQLCLGGRTFLWHQPQWSYATPTRSDVLVMNWNLNYASLVPGLLRARAAGVATILWGHGYSKREAGWRITARRRAARLASALLFYNHGAARAYLEAGFDRERVFVALNALDQAPIQAARARWLGRPAALADFRRRQGIGDGPAILFVSRLDPDNRLDLLVRAAADLRRRRPSVRVLIVGDGPDGPHVRQLVRDLGLEGTVVLAGTIYDEEQLAPWFLSSAAFCYPANVGLSLLHAFGYGLPVVTSDRLAAHNPEIEAFRDGANGLLYRDGDVPSLVAALARLLAEPALADRLGVEALRTVRERFTLDNMVDGFAAAIRHCAGSGRETGRMSWGSSA